MKKVVITVVLIICAVLMAIPVTRALILEEFHPNPAPSPTSDYIILLSRQSRKPEGVVQSDAAGLTIQENGIRDLISRFPRRPQAYAALLEIEENSLGELNAVQTPQRLQQANQSLADANAALEIDGGNGFFMTEKMVALLYLGRRDESFACGQIAAKMSRFDEYRQSLYDGAASDLRLKYGWVSSIDAIRLMTNQQLPNVLAIRLATAEFVREAVSAESRGDIDAGWKLRKCAAEIGSAIAKSPHQSDLCVFVGTEIKLHALNSLSGSPTDTKIGQYSSFLNQHGRHELAIQAEQETVNAQKMKATAFNLENQNDITQFPPLRAFSAEYALSRGLLWIVGLTAILVLFSNIFKRLIPKPKPDDFDDQNSGAAVVGLIAAVALGFLFVGISAIPVDNAAVSDSYREFGVMFHVRMTLSISLLFLLILSLVFTLNNSEGAPGFLRSLESSSLTLLSASVLIFALTAPFMLANNKKSIDMIFHRDITNMAQSAHIAWPPARQ
jgi:hypothetical protein